MRPVHPDFRLDVRNPKKRYPHRCMRRLSKGKEDKVSRKCGVQRTFRYGENPPCPSCGSTVHWTINTHEARKVSKRNQWCRCDVLLYKHSIYTSGCANNPKEGHDYYDMGASLVTSKHEVPF